jgi:hypothetical protein
LIRENIEQIHANIGLKKKEVVPKANPKTRGQRKCEEGSPSKSKKEHGPTEKKRKLK